ncbi:hypothetical protein G3O08_00215 [Cryomorpha ignava]|uniref:DUF7793 domain-containing protein n=1 Tax=Cryomorpha ignava TaxID=101383 RepID=A0A7K3WJX3_9FLAO|nr:hypothetical protein [Cryomorpha ignava]NEN21926.1 hypothetical protein [Cryomorpha ignava]
MTEKKLDLGNCTLEALEWDVVELHINPEQILQPDDVRKIFDEIHKKFPKGKTLMVTAGDKATLSPEARELASSEDITHQILADAIVTEHYSHQMSSNFFVRYNQPYRPTKLFKTIEEAKDWLKSYAAE